MGLSISIMILTHFPLLMAMMEFMRFGNLNSLDKRDNGISCMV
jgi:hypothetical protein